jgi:acid phosphatase
MLEEFSNPSVSGKKPGVLSKLFGKSTSNQPTSSESARAPLSSFPGDSREAMHKHYVRIRYNDRPVTIPGCAAKSENHLPGDETFCTLDAFKEIVDKFTPSDWQTECTQNLGAGLHGPADSAKSTAGF